MRSIVAAALVAAAFVPVNAHAGPADCLDPLFASAAPQFVYYNPEIGGYYVDVAAIQSFVGAQPGRATAAAACLATSPSPGAGACARAFLASDVPGNVSPVTIGEYITVDTAPTEAFVAAVAGNTQAFVNCLV